MRYLPLLVLELLFFPVPLIYIIISGSYSIIPVVFILCNCTLIWFLQYGMPILNSRINYHTAGYGLPVLAAIILFHLKLPMSTTIFISLFLFILTAFLYTSKEPLRISVYSGTLSLVLTLIIIAVSLNHFFLAPEILEYSLKGFLSINPYFLPVPVAILIIVVLINMIHGEIALPPVYIHILTSLTVLSVIATSGLIIPIFPVCRLRKKYIQIFSFRMMIYISLFQYFLSRFHIMILLSGSLISIIAEFLILYKRRSLYSDSRIHIIHLQR